MTSKASAGALVGAMAGASLALLLCLGTSARADSIPYPNPGTLNPATYTFTAAFTGDVIAYFAGSSAGFENTLGLQINGVSTGIFGLNNHTSVLGDSLNLGFANAGDVLTFVLHNVSPGNGDLFSDPALNGPYDGLLVGTQHIYSTRYTATSPIIDSIPVGVFVSFEDLPFRNSNFNYDDLDFVFTNVTAAETPAPAALPLFATGLGALGLLGWRRKRRAHATAVRRLAGAIAVTSTMTSKTSVKALFGAAMLLAASVVVQPSTGHATTINSTIHGFTADNIVPPDGLGDQANAFTVEVAPNARGIIEFNIFGLAGPVSSATLILPVTFNNLAATRSFTLLGYTGDGALTPNDYELPASPTSIGSFSVIQGALDSVHVDVTAFINAQIALNADFAGFKVVSNSLATGELIEFGETIPGHIPVSATLDVSATPLPAALPLFASGIGALGLFGWRRKRKAAAPAA